VLAVAEYAVEVAEVVARAVVPSAEVLDEKACAFAVFLGFVVLLAVLNQTSLPVVRGVVARFLDDFLGRPSSGTGLQLLTQPRACLRPVIAFSVVLRPWLLAGPVRFAVPFLHAFWVRFLTDAFGRNYRTTGFRRAPGRRLRRSSVPIPTSGCVR